MSAALHLAGPGDLDRLLPLITAAHALRGLEGTPEGRTAALAPILSGSPHGAAWLIGPRKAPVGCLILGFGWSVAAGGLTGHVEEFFIRASVRGRGMGTEALAALLGELADTGLAALTLDLPEGQSGVEGVYRRMGFRPATRTTMRWQAPGG